MGRCVLGPHPLTSSARSGMSTILRGGGGAGGARESMGIRCKGQARPCSAREQRPQSPARAGRTQRRLQAAQITGQQSQGPTHLAARLAVTSHSCLVPQKTSTLCPPCTVSRHSRAVWSESCAWQGGEGGEGVRRRHTSAQVWSGGGHGCRPGWQPGERRRAAAAAHPVLAGVPAGRHLQRAHHLHALVLQVQALQRERERGWAGSRPRRGRPRKSASGSGAWHEQGGKNCLAHDLAATPAAPPHPTCLRKDCSGTGRKSVWYSSAFSQLRQRGAGTARGRARQEGSSGGTALGKQGSKQRCTPASGAK